jgi:hypothetical protein
MISIESKYFGDCLIILHLIIIIINILSGFPNDRPVSSLTQSEWIKIFREVIKQNNGAGLYYALRKLPDALKNICEEAVDGSNLLEFVSLHHIHISSCIYIY